MSTDKELLTSIEPGIKKYYKKCRELSNYITEHPEVSGQEKESSNYIVEFLKNEGYEVEFPCCGVKHSFKAVNPKQKRKLKVALMCEYDALPDIGHACGHSLSGAISILAALALKDAYPDFPFQVDLIGTPCEEEGGGKILLMNAGAFEGYEFAAMVHLGSENLLYDNILASTALEFTFYGKLAHASDDPWNGINALNSTQLMFHAFDMMRQHLTPDCQIHGIITQGGVAPNIVPDKCVSVFYPRAGSYKMLIELCEKMKKCAEGAAIATGATFSIEELGPAYAEIYTGPKVVNLVRKVYDDMNLTYSEKLFPNGSLDAGNLSLQMPVFHPYVAIAPGKNNLKLHTKEFEAAIRSEDSEECMINATKVLCDIVSTLAFNQNLLALIKEEHYNYRNSD